MPDARTLAGARYALELDGAALGFAAKVAGGSVSAEVVNETGGSDAFVRKHIGGPKYEPFELALAAPLPQPLTDWIAASWQQNYQRKDGAIVGYDLDGKARTRRTFFNALITETTIPKLDAASKDAAHLTVKIAPELTRAEKASGKAPAAPKTKLASVATFRLEIDGLDCTKVSSIGSFTVKQSAATDEIGDARDLQREPARLEFPNLRITLAAASAESWRDWFTDFVLKGKNDEAHERAGILTLLAADTKTALLTVSFRNLGIFRLDDDWTAMGDKVSRVTAELYCEQMLFGPVKKPAPRRLDPAVRMPR